MYSIDDDTFETIVTKAIDNIPKKYAEHISNLAFVVEDIPNIDQRTRLRLKPHQTLFGLYEGIPLTKRGANYNLVLPDKITIFKKPIEYSVSTLDELKKQVEQTIWHEVAHYYGLGHYEIHELEDKDRDINAR